MRFAHHRHSSPYIVVTHPNVGTRPPEHARADGSTRCSGFSGPTRMARRGVGAVETQRSGGWPALLGGLSEAAVVRMSRNQSAGGTGVLPDQCDATDARGSAHVT